MSSRKKNNYLFYDPPIHHQNGTTIYLSKHKYSESQYIIKKTKKSLQTLNEAHLLSKLNHPNIMRIIEYFETSRHMYIVTEYVGQ